MAEMKKRISGRSNDAKQPSDSQEQCASPEDLPCIHCGYNLRGLAPDGRCPECGTSIARSIHGDLLSAADPAWLTRVSQGLTLVYAVFVTFLASIAVLIVVAVIFKSFGWHGTFSPQGLTRTVLLFLFAALPIAAVILLLLGIFGLTTPDPRLRLTEQPIVLRRIVRGAAIVSVLLTNYGLKLFDTAFSGLSLSASRQVNAFGHGVVQWAFNFALVFTLAAASLYLAHLAERIPDIERAKRFKSTVRRFAVVCAILMLCVALDFALESVPWALGRTWGTDGGGNPSLGGGALEALILGIGTIAMLGSYIYGFSLIGKGLSFRKAIKLCLVETRKVEGS